MKNSVFFILVVIMGCSATEPPTPVDDAPASDPVATTTCSWYAVHMTDYTRGNGTRTGRVRAYPVVTASRHQNHGTVESSLNVAAIGCGAVLVHEIEASLTYATVADRDAATTHPVFLTTPTVDGLVKFASAVDALISRDSPEAPVVWTDGLQDTDDVTFGRIETLPVDASTSTNLVISATMPANVDPSTVKVAVSSIVWTDAETGQVFRTNL